MSLRSGHLHSVASLALVAQDLRVFLKLVNNLKDTVLQGSLEILEIQILAGLGLRVWGYVVSGLRQGTSFHSAPGNKLSEVKTKVDKKQN